MASTTSKGQLVDRPVGDTNVLQGGVDNLGIRMKHVLAMLLSFCGDSVERTQRHVMLVNLCEQVVSWAPSYFEQENLNDMGYQIYFVAYFGRHAINHSAHKQRLHRKRFTRNLPEDFVSSTLSNEVFARWTRSKHMTTKSTSTPVQAGAHKFLIETIDIWLGGSSMDLSMSFNTELDGIQRHLNSLPKSQWPSFIISRKGGERQSKSSSVGDDQVLNLQNQLNEIKLMLLKQQQQGSHLEQGSAGTKPFGAGDVFPGGDQEQARSARTLSEQRGL